MGQRIIGKGLRLFAETEFAFGFRPSPLPFIAIYNFDCGFHIVGAYLIAELIPWKIS